MRVRHPHAKNVDYTGVVFGLSGASQAQDMPGETYEMALEAIEAAEKATADKRHRRLTAPLRPDNNPGRKDAS